MARHYQAKPEQGERFVRLRASANLTQREVATAVGVMPVTVSHWELGLCFPAPGRLLDLAKLYGVAVDELLSDTPIGEPHSDSEADELLNDSKDTA